MRGGILSILGPCIPTMTPLRLADTCWTIQQKAFPFNGSSRLQISIGRWGADADDASNAESPPPHLIPLSLPLTDVERTKGMAAMFACRPRFRAHRYLLPGTVL
ncbi:uncharacterized protein BDV17DRAFT_250540 [Aspergillus undulatus]|uniref:uncharacterized protein n=1 Tax=Aspergillus undulatus TaxID=1810928 RepID=UPI003CCE1214